MLSGSVNQWPGTFYSSAFPSFLHHFSPIVISKNTKVWWSVSFYILWTGWIYLFYAFFSISLLSTPIFKRFLNTPLSVERQTESIGSLSTFFCFFYTPPLPPQKNLTLKTNKQKKTLTPKPTHDHIHRSRSWEMGRAEAYWSVHRANKYSHSVFSE